MYRLPDILSQEEILAISRVMENVKHRTILMLIYSVGLRIEVVVRITVAVIDSKRIMIHI